ncbi:SPE_1075/MLC_0560 family membrane protein [Spiroplasma chrysopicola]|uniref:Transmembrane protein n=1 Tax=Spiroplasma chrysopicola DF-1 TaxID=1276227 RepID=R4UGW2_9MOLU|nr:hypothetical protein [Spiroplasma chrysopicola]AGM25395.1 hypothetical protein SCHRY_v1c08190 [Spiroplasma chrysopicola DF-1]
MRINERKIKIKKEKIAREKRNKKRKYLNLKDFGQSSKAFRLYVNEKRIFFKAHWRSMSFRIFFYLVGVYIFGLSVSLYMDLNLGVVNEDLIVFALIADIWTKGGDNVEEYYAIMLVVVYLGFWLFVVLFKVIKLIQFHRKKRLTLTLIYDEIFKMILDLVPVFLWPAAVQLNVLIINPAETIKPLDPSHITGSQAQWNEWIRSWILWASYLLFCLGLAIIVSTKMLEGPYNGLSGELALITKVPYAACRVIVDMVLLVVGLGILFLGQYPISERLSHLYSWVSYATILMAFFAGPLIGLIVVTLERYIKIELIDVNRKLYRKLRREVIREFRYDNPDKKTKLKWTILQDNILKKYNVMIKETFIEEFDDAELIDKIIK